MRQITTEIEINASVEKVWAILTDFKKYPQWNPFIKSIDGEIVEGATFEVTLEQPDSKPMVFKPKCLKFEKSKALLMDVILYKFIACFFIFQ